MQRCKICPNGHEYSVILRRKRLPWCTSEVYRLREEVERRNHKWGQPAIRTRFSVKDFQGQFFGLSEFDTERSGSWRHALGSGLFTSWPGSRPHWSQCFHTSSRFFSGYGLEDPGIESRWRRDIPCPDRPWGPTSLPYNGYRLFPGVKSGRGVTLTSHPLLVPWSWKNKATPLLLLSAVQPVQSLSACTRVQFTFFTQSFAVDTHVVPLNTPRSLLSISFPNHSALHKNIIITNMEAYRESRGIVTVVLKRSTKWS